MGVMRSILIEMFYKKTHLIIMELRMVNVYSIILKEQSLESSLLRMESQTVNGLNTMKMVKYLQKEASQRENRQAHGLITIN